MQYFFILGKNPTLSFAEIVAVFGLKPEQILYLGEEALIIELEQEIDAQQIIRRLGGTIKIGIINYQLRITNLAYRQAGDESMSNDLMSKLMPNQKEPAGKFHFGISYYGKGKFKQEKALAMEIKKALKEKGVSSRWVTSREKTLSSVVVEQNKLTSERGVEIVIVGDGAKYWAGKTLAVQPFKELSARDYGRPGRDDYSGMLPPKLAQMMINLTTSPLPCRQAGLTPLLRKGEGNHFVRVTSPSPYQGEGRGEVVLDPFCGSGTIITEAALMGYRNIIGCDISEKAAKDTKDNINWIAKKHLISNIQYQIFQCDVKQLSRQIKPNSIDAIVTEPYLGPSRMEWNEKNISQVARELENLYGQAILEFYKALKPDGRIVMVWPIFKIKGGEIKLAADKILGSNFKIINLLAEFLPNKIIKLSERSTIVYGRPNQKVWREIVVLTRRDV
ncbi:hypothetical protein COU01_03990 [Candidatus Falkowbacteria bacterium CG10_big_fil_rev_8_21_14_0_10_44_15]|uniref:Methyltransferase n=1 Tax=Candidatus Falkowbacteria bacterium CG10_big_fil_rev_8_21_14_0_10_44_15 TaxID=1974569 RepID=A0A2H0UYX2_9BACT|nr:MAG: hypothetical protein COU01_03990 [Candidatus Falkowbacteria bacterium CG10_big_fil_rev_8_21_14_0_10_44_15]